MCRNMWKLLLVLQFMLITANCVTTNQFKPVKVHIKTPDSRIVGGKEVEPNSIPYQVAVTIDGLVLCGGSIISVDFVLTAAHCLWEKYSAEVFLGIHDRLNTTEPNSISILAEKLISHQDFDYFNAANDVALLKLSQSVIFNEYIQPVMLPSLADGSKEYKGETATASGWGRDRDGTISSMILRSVDIKITDWQDCADAYNPAGGLQVTGANICTSGYRKKGTCGGDSGGPLVINGTVVGIASWGSSFCESCRQSVFTRVESHLEWILANMKPISSISATMMGIDI